MKFALSPFSDWLLRSQHNRTLNEAGKLWSRVTAGELSWDEGYLLPGVHKSSMKALSGLMTEADEIVNL